MLMKRKRYKNPKILEAANGEECTMNSPDCNGDNRTSVFCHLNESFAGKGMGQKADDFSGFIGCSGCHKWYDQNIGSYEDRIFYAMRAQNRTLRILFDKGVIK